MTRFKETIQSVCVASKILMLHVLLSANAAAQQSSSVPDSAKEKGPEVKALLLIPGVARIELLTLVEETLSEPFNVGATGISQPFFPNARNFALVIKDQSSESGFKKISSVTLPPAGNRFLLLLEPIDKNSMKTHVIDGRNSNFPINSNLIFNTTDTPIGITLDKQKQVVTPRRVEIVPAPPRDGEVPYYQVELYVSEGDRIRQFSSSRWLHRSAGRNYVFIYRQKETGRFRYRSFNESISEKP